MKHARMRIDHAATHLFLIAACVFINFPLFWMVSSSFKTSRESIQFPPKFLPERLSLDNYIHTWSNMNFGRYFFNTVYVSFLAVLIAMAVGTVAGYAFSRFRIRAKRQILVFILFFRMLPPILFILPLFFILQRLGLYNRLEGVMLSVTTIALPFAVWMMKNYINTIPHEIDEAAMIDGCSRFSAFHRIILPLCKPGIVATSVFCLLTAWNEFMFANILIHSESRRTLVVALYSYLGDFNIEWNMLMAASTLTMLPVIVFFGIIQKKLTEGFAGSSITG
jgi:ABC-type glycerol-3-phosphate transport system permease component